MGLFGYRGAQIGADYSPQTRSYAMPAQQVSDPGGSAPMPPPNAALKRKRRGLFGSIAHSLSVMDDDPTFGDLLLGGVDRLDMLRARQQQAQQNAALTEAVANDPTVPESIRGYIPFRAGDIVGKAIEGAYRPQRPTEAPRPLVTMPGAEIPELDPVTGLPRTDPETGLPIIVYRNNNFKPPAPARAPTMRPPTQPPPGFVME